MVITQAEICSHIFAFEYMILLFGKENILTVEDFLLETNQMKEKVRHFHIGAKETKIVLRSFAIKLTYFSSLYEYELTFKLKT